MACLSVRFRALRKWGGRAQACEKKGWNRRRCRSGDTPRPVSVTSKWTVHRRCCVPSSPAAAAAAAAALEGVAAEVAPAAEKRAPAALEAGGEAGG